MRLLSLLAPPLCAACGAAGEPLCGRCRRRLTWLGPLPVDAQGVRAWAPVAYTGPARDLVRALKFGGARGVAETMAAQMAANAPAELLRGTLVPVPLHPARLRRRGYDQAALLAEALAARTGLPLTRCLERRGSAAAQVGRTRAERITGPPGVIETAGEVPREVLLVDDVLTTGATLASCARAVEGSAMAITYARTPGR
jgi:predicted amidophosphoribosyltransferase